MALICHRTNEQGRGQRLACGTDPAGDAIRTTDELVHQIATWIVTIWQRRKLGEYAPAGTRRQAQPELAVRRVVRASGLRVASSLTRAVL